MEENAQEMSNKETSKNILRYPFNGRSSYLIDKFFIIGYNYSTIKKYLYNNERLKKILENNKLNKENNSDSDLQKFNFEENPKVLNEFTSDYEKETMEIDTIMEMMFPKKINLFFTETKNIYSKSPEKKNKKGEDIDKINDDSSLCQNFFVFQDEKNNNIFKELLSKEYNVIFSSNPQSGNNSKKSINGFAYVFYKKLKEEKNYENKIYSFYIPIVFCIISEFPFYNSFYELCKSISLLFNKSDIKVPLEIILYNIIKLTPSPLNANINLFLKLNFKDKSERISKETKPIPEEEDEDDDDSNNFCNFSGITNDSFLKSVQIGEDLKMAKSEINLKEINKKKLEAKKSVDIQNFSYPKKDGKNTLKKLKTEIITDEAKQKKSVKSKNDKFSKIIKFNFLTGYPLMQYNLAKVLLQTLSPTDVIIVFFYTFLEKDVIFFSKDLEYLSLTINSYLNLNFPLNDEKYYFHNVTVSYDNYINQNSSFVGSTFTTIIGINDSYNPKYQNSSMNKLKDHIAIDLDKGKLYKIEDNNDKEKNKKNKELFSFIKSCCKNKETKNEKSILQREVENLHNSLENLYDNIKYYGIYKSKAFISYDKNIKNLNTKIQEYFYRLINHISMYFYQNLSIKVEGDDMETTNKVQRMNSKKEYEEKMNVMFIDNYKKDDVYSKEELHFVEELRETMKFESFVYGFVQSYNPIDLYKIPLTFTEEFISFISRKGISDKKISFLHLIDELYDVKNKKIVKINLKAVISEYNNKYKTYFDRYIKENDNNNNSDKLKIKIFNDDIIKYKGYELDSKIIMKYIKIISDLEQKENEENGYSKLLKKIKNNIPKMISVRDIETVIEKYSIDYGILSSKDLCGVNIILLFALSLSYMKSITDCNDFLGSLFQNFIIFRKYYSIILNKVFSLYDESISKKEYNRAQEYYNLYYLCINSLRSFHLIPNESLMEIINKFNEKDIKSLKFEDNREEKEGIIEDDKDKVKNSLNKDIKLYGIDLPEKEITPNNLYMIYNFNSNKSVSEKDLILLINSHNKKNEKNEIDKIFPPQFIKPSIRFNNGIDKMESKLYSQGYMNQELFHQYDDYIIDGNEKKLKYKLILDACLNILIFIRNSDFVAIEEIKEMVKKIFYIFLNQFRINDNHN